MFTADSHNKKINRYINPSQAHAKSSKNRPEENDETDSESSLLKSQIKSFEFASSPVPRNFCSSDGEFSNYSGQFSQLPPHSGESLTKDTNSFQVAAAAATAVHHMNNQYSSPAGHVENWHVPYTPKCGECYTLESTSNWLSNTGMPDLSWNRSFGPPSSVSSQGTLGLSHLEPGFPLQSYPYQPPGPFLPQNPCRPRVSVYVPEPGHFPPMRPGRADHSPYGTPGLIPPNGPGNVSFQRAVAPTDPVNTNAPFSLPLPREQRKVFVTYATDNDKHVEEVIKFVALLIRNGFETQIDMFEQHFRSINKIDWMERYINDKGYLIIIVISPKYWEAVTSQNFELKNDEHSLNTVFIYKQLQNEFIQNGSKNFRFVPIIFPGANMKHVPSWLQNTHVYCWPMHSQDILRRLMRLEKYNPPPVGELPTIIQKSI
ncbi:E3 ubiquitin ligase TRAF3IP2 isoform X1 [Carcharodon carcharias]|uniref:E3 ubiquitin ligase TRAF3IP2 isoform X1 n=2 Tax=Carcharodon carcharias TaxID=13397 RepID=UPI001B7F73D6|nr:E3 ubiquitin ligase TRAF3IP2 isoform X1 [Carcharodon carcharias]XP_041067674.1 E3 ubiquitin ligase TRAF3IP2 isoform X1 [Carcharodon carcharias]XP_041067675.1 E3 ubiquitin ligase TRAF3IP2 isoform X1 [Carcharodon carcharias]